MEEIIREVVDERELQDKKWGTQNHKPIEWIAILTEEVGEASKNALEGHFCYSTTKVDDDDLTFIERRNIHYKSYREELIQVAAVAIAMIESLDRNKS